MRFRFTIRDEQHNGAKPNSAGMKVALILVLVAGLWTNEARASLVKPGKNNYTFTVCGNTFGLADWQDGISIAPFGGGRTWTTLYFGPFHSIDVPFTAIQGLIGFCGFITIAIGLAIVLAARWRKRLTSGT